MWKNNKKQSSEIKFQILNAFEESENIIQLFDKCKQGCCPEILGACWEKTKRKTSQGFKDSTKDSTCGTRANNKKISLTQMATTYAKVMIILHMLIVTLMGIIMKVALFMGKDIQSYDLNSNNLIVARYKVHVIHGKSQKRKNS